MQFHTSNLDMSLTIHGEVFTVSGALEGLTWMHNELAKVWSVVEHIFGPVEGKQKTNRDPQPLSYGDPTWDRVRGRSAPH